MAKFVLTLIILYLIIRAAVSLLRATRYGIPGSNPPSSRTSASRNGIDRDWEVKRTVTGKTYQQEWSVGQPRQNGRRKADIEDARWRDV